MNIMDLWGTGQATAEEAARRRAARWDEPAPVPAKLMAGMVSPLTNFNRPGGDPVEQAANLGMMGILPFKGRIAAAAPVRTPQEALWGRAQQTDYLPPEGSVPPLEPPLPWEGYIPMPPDKFGQIPLHPDDPASAILKTGVPYDEWQEMLRKLNVSPNVLPRINPFRT